MPSVSAAAWKWIEQCCRGQSLGPVRLKGKGDLEVFRVDSLR